MEYSCTCPILAIFDQNLSTFLYTDASGLGLGAILKQTQEDGDLHPKKKANYLVCLAINESIQYW